MLAGMVERQIGNLDIAEAQIPVLRPYILGKLVQLYLRQDNLSEAEAALAQGRTDPNQEVLPFSFQSIIILAEAELALRRGNYERALALTHEVKVL